MDKENSFNLTPVKKFESLNLSSTQKNRKPLYPSLDGFSMTHKSPNQLQNRIFLNTDFDTEKSLESSFSRRLNKSVLEELNNRTEKIKGSLSYRQKQGGLLKSNTLKDKHRFSSAHSSIFDKMESIKDHCAAQRLERQIIEEPAQDGERSSMLHTATKRRRTIRGRQEIREPIKTNNTFRLSSKSYNLNEILLKSPEGTCQQAPRPTIPNSRSGLLLKQDRSNSSAFGRKKITVPSFKNASLDIPRGKSGNINCPQLGSNFRSIPVIRNTRLPEKKTETITKPIINTHILHRHQTNLPKTFTNQKVNNESKLATRNDTNKTIPRSVSSKVVERLSKDMTKNLGTIPRSRTVHNDLNVSSSAGGSMSIKTRPAWR